MRQSAIMISCLLTLGCSGETVVTNEAAIQPMLGAVMNSRPEKVRALAAQGTGLEERDPSNQSTPIIAAAETMQWEMVEVLLDHGANIWAHDQFGITAAETAQSSRVLPGSKQDQARLRVIDKLKARGYPFPPPKSDEVLKLVEEGRWPPVQARS